MKRETILFVLVLPALLLSASCHRQDSPEKARRILMPWRHVQNKHKAERSPEQEVTIAFFDDLNTRAYYSLQTSGIEVTSCSCENDACSVSVREKDRARALRILEDDAKRYSYQITLFTATGKKQEINPDKAPREQPYAFVYVAKIHKGDHFIEEVSSKVIDALLAEGLGVGCGGDFKTAEIHVLEHEREKAERVLREQSRKYPGWIHFVDDAERATKNPYENPRPYRPTYD